MGESVAKTCSKCKREKKIEDFGRNGKKHLGRCKECLADAARKLRQRSPNMIRNRERRYYQNAKSAQRMRAEYKRRAINPSDTQMCRQCKREMRFEQFATAQSTRTGFQNVCRQCISDNNKRYNSTVQNVRREKCKAYYEANKEFCKNISREWRRENPRKHRDAILKALYGLTLDKYEEMLASQEGLCAICRRPESQANRKNLNVDHNHSTGEVRGLLCSLCNRAIGYFQDDISILMSAVSYLKKAKSNTSRQAKCLPSAYG